MIENENNVVNPAYYASIFKIQIECITLVRELPFSLGNAIKYVWRAFLKGDNEKGVEDLKKAVWYINDEINNPRFEQRHRLIIEPLLKAMESESPGWKMDIISSIARRNVWKARRLLECKIQEFGK